SLVELIAYRPIEVIHDVGGACPLNTSVSPCLHPPEPTVLREFPMLNENPAGNWHGAFRGMLLDLLLPFFGEFSSVNEVKSSGTNVHAVYRDVSFVQHAKCQRETPSPLARVAAHEASWDDNPFER